MNRRSFLGAALALASLPLAGLLPAMAQQPYSDHAGRAMNFLDEMHGLPEASGKTFTFQNFNSLSGVSTLDVTAPFKIIKDDFGYGVTEGELADSLKTYYQPWEGVEMAPSIGHRVVYDAEVLNENWLVKVDDGTSQES